jgi:hypothetical protein
MQSQRFQRGYARSKNDDEVHDLLVVVSHVAQVDESSICFCDER